MENEKENQKDNIENKLNNCYCNYLNESYRSPVKKFNSFFDNDLLFNEDQNNFYSNQNNMIENEDLFGQYLSLNQNNNYINEDNPIEYYEFNSYFDQPAFYQQEVIQQQQLFEEKLEQKLEEKLEQKLEEKLEEKQLTSNEDKKNVFQIVRDFRQQPQKKIMKKRGPYKKYTVEQKLGIINKIQNSYDLKFLSKQVKIEVKTLKRWGQKGAYRQKGGGRKVQDSDMEAKLFEKLKEELMNKRQKIPKAIIKQYARRLSNVEGFKASKGWNAKFNSRFQFEEFQEKICLLIIKKVIQFLSIVLNDYDRL